MSQFSSKKCSIEVSRPVLIRNQCIKAHGGTVSKLVAPQKLSLHHIIKGTYLWEEVDNGSVDIGPPYSSCSIGEFDIKEGECMVVNTSNLIAVTKDNFPVTYRFYDLLSFLDFQHLYHVIRGCSKFYMFGGGDLDISYIDGRRVFVRNTVIAFTASLEKEIVPLNTSFLGVLNRPEPFDEAYTGTGWVITQSSLAQPTKGEGAKKNKLIDYINAFFGMR